MKERDEVLWAVLWRSKNRLDGERSFFLRDNLVPMLFKTRAKARAFIATTYGYLHARPDLQREPHGWRMPIPVRVTITVSGTEKGQ